MLIDRLWLTHLHIACQLGQIPASLKFDTYFGQMTQTRAGLTHTQTLVYDKVALVCVKLILVC
jgi:hypothetical protein